MLTDAYLTCSLKARCYPWQGPSSSSTKAMALSPTNVNSQEFMEFLNSLQPKCKMKTNLKKKRKEKTTPKYSLFAISLSTWNEFSNLTKITMKLQQKQIIVE